VELRAHGSSRIEIGDDCRIDRGIRLLGANQSVVILEDGVRVGLYTVFNGGDSIRIGRNSLISGFVYLQTSMHNYHGPENIKHQGYSHKPIVLGKDTWIGTHAVLFPGIELGDGCVVGSTSVVNKSFDKNSIVAGIPAVLKKTRHPNE
jgi:acetyltransferase-like isoleucine patch superfamily enzyme